jgi:hypothetical protein
MANAFDRDLKEGDRLVLADGRRAVCRGKLFGALPATTGTALDVMVEGDTTPMTIHAIEDVDAIETIRQFAKHNGWEDAAALEERVRNVCTQVHEVREIFRRVAEGANDHGDFLKSFARAVLYADPENFALLMFPAALLIAKYHLRETPKEAAKP